MNANMLTERRQYSRFNVTFGPVVLLEKPCFFYSRYSFTTQLGPILNVSKGGLAIQYFENKRAFKRSSTIRIITNVPNIHQIDKLNFQV